MESQAGPSSGNSTGRRRVWPWVVGAVVVLLALLIGVVILILVVAPSGISSGGGGGSAQRVSWDEEYVSGGGLDKIAVLPVSGEISEESSQGLLSGGSSATPGALQSQLDQAAGDSSVKAVILEVNSPGGSVVASDEMHDAILDFKRQTGKPVVVSMQDLAASGGYYISTAADDIVANKSTFTGSIGVILSLLNYSKAAEKYGIKQNAITSGKFKEIGSPWKKLSPQERDILQGLVDESYSQFVGVVAKGRNLPEDKVRKIADGRVYSGKQAKDLGLVDKLGNLDTATEDARKLSKLKRAEVVRYVQSPGLLQSLQARLAPSEPEAVQVLKAAGLDTSPGLKYIYRPGMQ